MSESARARLRRLVTALALSVLASSAYAQFDSGQISGVVKDSQDASVPGATVRVVNESTRLERTFTSDSSGYYVAPLLPPASTR